LVVLNAASVQGSYRVGKFGPVVSRATSQLGRQLEPPRGAQRPASSSGQSQRLSGRRFRRYSLVSRFFKFPIQMNFAENQKWPTSPVWRGAVQNSLGGYMRDNLGPARVQGAPQGRLLDKRRGKGVVVLSGEFLESCLESFPEKLSWIGICQSGSGSGLGGDTG
jgi:hypothetical protein